MTGKKCVMKRLYEQSDPNKSIIALGAVKSHVHPFTKKENTLLGLSD